MPFIIGVHSSCFFIEKVPSDVMIVHIDHNLILRDIPVVPLPSRVRRKLFNRLNKHCQLKFKHDNAGLTIPLVIQKAYPARDIFIPLSNKRSVARTGNVDYQSDSEEFKSSADLDSGKLAQSITSVASFGPSITTKFSVAPSLLSSRTLKTKMFFSNIKSKLTKNRSQEFEKDDVVEEKPTVKADPKMVVSAESFQTIDLNEVEANVESIKSNVESIKSNVESIKSNVESIKAEVEAVKQEQQMSPTLKSRLLSKTKNFRESFKQKLKIESTGKIGNEFEQADIKQLGHLFHEIETGDDFECYNCTLHIPDDTCYACRNCDIVIHNGCLNHFNFPCYSVFQEDHIQSAFLKVFTSLFKSYRKYLMIPSNSEVVCDPWSTSTWDFFKREEFLHSFSKFDDNSNDSMKKRLSIGGKNSYVTFLKTFTGTQMFSHFVYDHACKSETDYEILYFVEMIKAKKNRSKVSKVMKNQRETPFLKDPSYRIQETVTIFSVNDQEVGEKGKC
jgi:archaellum component FlaC